MRSPSSTPDGILIDRVFCRFTRPAPPQGAHGSCTTLPVPWQVEQVWGNAKLTLKHGEIKGLDMPPMTMVFTVKDKAALDKLQVGDKIRFKAENDKGKLTVSEIEAVR